MGCVIAALIPRCLLELTLRNKGMQRTQVDRAPGLTYDLLNEDIVASTCEAPWFGSFYFLRFEGPLRATGIATEDVVDEPDRLHIISIVACTIKTGFGGHTLHLVHRRVACRH